MRDLRDYAGDDHKIYDMEGLGCGIRPRGLYATRTGLNGNDNQADYVNGTLCRARPHSCDRFYDLNGARYGAGPRGLDGSGRRATTASTMTRSTASAARVAGLGPAAVRKRAAGLTRGLLGPGQGRRLGRLPQRLQVPRLLRWSRGLGPGRGRRRKNIRTKAATSEEYPDPSALRGSSSLCHCPAADGGI